MKYFIASSVGLLLGLIAFGIAFELHADQFRQGVAFGYVFQFSFWAAMDYMKSEKFKKTL